MSNACELTDVDVDTISDALQDEFTQNIRENPMRLIILFDRRRALQKICFLNLTGKVNENVVTEALDELIATKPKLKEFKTQIIDYFGANVDSLGVKLQNMTAKDLALHLTTYCGTKKIKKFVPSLRRKLLGKFAASILEKHGILKQFRKNHVIELEYQIKVDPNGDGKAVRAYLHFGDQQKVRFWPEQLVRLIPRLFLKDNTKLKQHLKRVYSNEYRHGFHTKLDDVDFTKYYKMLTGWNHESVNYHRFERTIQRIGYPEFMTKALSDDQLLEITLRFLIAHDYDSDAILGDVAHAVATDGKDSNIAQICPSLQLVHSLYNFTSSSKAQCKEDNVLEIWDCNYVVEMIRNLRMFQHEKFEIDAGNVGDMDHSSVITSFKINCFGCFWCIGVLMY